MTAPTALIADDEAPLRTHLRRRLAALWPELTLCGEAANGVEALELLAVHRPDVAFLDIRMPGLTGLEVAARLTQPCHIVFITAYEQYALAAFEHEAVDYLHKPVTEQRLRGTIERLKRHLAGPAPDLHALLGALRGALERDSSYLRWIRVAQGDEIRLISADEVLCFQAQDKYTVVTTPDGEWLIRAPVKELEAALDPRRFWRVHRSTLVRVDAIERVTRDFRGRLLLSLRGQRDPLAVSRAYAHRFRQM
jgi:DNA-binding LytR/AlgR family response regulator